MELVTHKKLYLVAGRISRPLAESIAAELGETAAGSPHYRVLFVIGIFLFCITFAINLTADLVIRGIKKK